MIFFVVDPAAAAGKKKKEGRIDSVKQQQVQSARHL
jgi:hypothetical protein